MKRTIFTLIALCALSFSAWGTTTTVTWDATDVASIDITGGYNSPRFQTVDDITITAYAPASDDYCYFSPVPNSGTQIRTTHYGQLTFAPVSGKLTDIVISLANSGYGYYTTLADGWSYDDNGKQLTWHSDAAVSSAVLNGTGNEILFAYVQSIEFTVEPASGTLITWNATNLGDVNVSMGDGISGDHVTQKINNITITADAQANGDVSEFYTPTGEVPLIHIAKNGKLTFAPESGKALTGITIFCAGLPYYPDNLKAGTGWTWEPSTMRLTWSGNAATSVNLECVASSSDGLYFNDITSVVYTEVDAAAGPTAITWYSGNGLTDINLTRYTNIKFTEDGDPQTYHNGSRTATIEDVTVTISAETDGAYASFYTYQNTTTYINLRDGGKVTFSTASDQFKKIVINFETEGGCPTSAETGWYRVGNTFVWSGTATNSVDLINANVSQITSIVFTMDDGSAPASSDGTITWLPTDVESVNVNMSSGYGSQTTKTIKNITVSAVSPENGDYCHFSTYVDETYNTSSTSIYIQNGGKLVFAPESGKLLTNIVITCNAYESDHPENLATGSGWTFSNHQLSWSGSARSVNLACNGSSDGVYFRDVASIVYTVITDPNPDPDPTFTWTEQQVNHVSLYCDNDNDSYTSSVIQNIILTLSRTRTLGQYDFCNFYNGAINVTGCGALTFESIVGKIKGIVITCDQINDALNLSDGWDWSSANTLTWSGTPSDEVTLSGTVVADISSIEFTYIPEAAPHMGMGFYGSSHQLYEITGAHTAKIAQQTRYSTLDIPDYEVYNNVTYYITEIDDYALYNQYEMPNVRGGSNIAKIGAHAFDGCFRMDEFTLYSYVLDNIGEDAFKDCKLMQTWECYTEMPPVLGSNVFAGNTYLNHICVRDFVVDNYQAAAGWSTYASKITALDPNPATGEQFFFKNQKTTGIYQVTSVSPKEAKVLPYTAEVNAIYPRTLENTLVISEEVTYIQRQYTITGIGANAYKDCADIDVVLIPMAVKSIEAGAFLGCTGVRNVFFLWDDPTGITWADGNVGAEFATAASGNTMIFVPQGKLAAYQEWAPAWASCMTEGIVEDVTATTDPNNNLRCYRTFYDGTTDYMMPPSVWAHAGYVMGNQFILHPVAFDGDILPKGTAVVLESETPNYRLIAMPNSSAAAYTGPNDLRGQDNDILVSSLGDDADKVYVLGKEATINNQSQVGMGMYRYTGTTLAGHKAYLIYNGPGSGSSGEQGAPIRFLFRHEDTATGVENAQGSNVQCTKILRDGQLIIIRDGKEYNAQGLMIK